MKTLLVLLLIIGLSGCAGTPKPTSPDPAIFRPKQPPVYVPPYYDHHRHD